MDNSVFLGVRLPDFPYQRICFNDIDLKGSLAESGLREKAANQFSLPGEEIVFVYRGRALETNGNLHAQGVRTGATIHVMRKRVEPEVDSALDQVPMTDEKLRQITTTFKRFTASRLWELSHPRVLSRILKLYPAIRDDLGALAILRDPILLSSMKSAENFREIAKQYPIFNQAAPAIADILQKLDSTKVRVPEFEDSESSSSSSSSEDLTANNPAGLNNNNNNNNTNNNNVAASSSRTITQQQLAEALAYVAGAAFRSAQTADSSSRDQNMEVGSAAPESNSTAASSEAPPISVSAPGGQAESSVDPSIRFANELIQMREMGLTDEAALQALLICNGDLEAAINLVFSSSN